MKHDIFENTKLRSGDYTEISSGEYGISAWDNYLNNNSFYLIKFNQRLDENICLFPSLKFKNVDHYLSFYQKKGITLDEFFILSDEVYNTLKRYNTSLIKISENKLFKSRLLNQLVFLSKEIYSKGYYNYPVLYFTGTEINNPFIFVHPGQHLYWVKQFLGLDTQSFLSVNHKYLETLNYYVKAGLINILKEVKTSKDIEEIYALKNISYDKINGFIITEGGQQVPSINCVIPDDEEWNKFEENGLNEWPWSKVNKFHNFYLNQPWIKIFKEDVDWDEFIEIKTNFNNNTLLLNNMFSFLLLNKFEDKNFVNKMFKE